VFVFAPVGTTPVVFAAFIGASEFVDTTFAVLKYVKFAVVVVLAEIVLLTVAVQLGFAVSFTMICVVASAMAEVVVLVEVIALVEIVAVLTVVLSFVVGVLAVREWDTFADVLMFAPV
jgi:hypothetical protein